MTVFFCEQDGGDWLENDMWLSDLHECDWYNMIGLDPCNRVEQMEMIRIHSNGLQGTLPSELSIVSTIYELTLSDNLITGTFPTDFAKMTELDTFVIAFNQFEGQIPGYFFRFPDMVYWDIGFNKFEGSLPDDIPRRMPDLQVMFAENNQLSGPIPSNLGTLDLKRVHLDDNALTGTIPSELGSPPNLQQLFLHGNQLNGPIPDSLANSKKLSEATFHFNNLEGEVSQSICENMFQNVLKTISVDCETVTCECCICGEPGV
jgi:Leucine-rich repeat (LRR) protein